MSAVNREWLVVAKQELEAAKQRLVCVIRALEKTGINFELAIKEIKENIGDLEASVEILRDKLT